jgi:transcriptional regulator with XRE-family HTH domain
MPKGAADSGRRMTNRQFAVAIGVTESYASLIRAGKRLPGAAALVSIATVFNLDANQLVRAYQRGPIAVAQFLEERLPRVE